MEPENHLFEKENNFQDFGFHPYRDPITETENGNEA